MSMRWVVLSLVAALFLGQPVVAGTSAEKPRKKEAGQATAKSESKPACPAAAAAAKPGEKPAAKAPRILAAEDDPFGAPGGKGHEKLVKQAKPKGGVTAAKQPSSVPRTEAILRALDKRVDIDFVESPITDVIDSLQEFLQVPIQMDVRALCDVGVSSDTPISRHLHDVSVRSALKLMLSELDLTWIIDGEVLLITTPEKAESSLETAIYDVHDLVAAQDEKGAPLNDFDQLIDVITTTTTPTTWDSVGGPGSIAPFENTATAVLVVSQTREVHEKITSLLAELRKASRAKPGEPVYLRTVRPDGVVGASMGGATMGGKRMYGQPPPKQPEPGKEPPKP